MFIIIPKIFILIFLYEIFIVYLMSGQLKIIIYHKSKLFIL